LFCGDLVFGWMRKGPFVLGGGFGFWLDEKRLFLFWDLCWFLVG
jgi:hypothetical protein